MKVKELAEFVEKETYFNVTHDEKWLDGDYPVDFLNCELEIKKYLCFFMFNYDC